jgi:acyl carrier protein
MIASITDQILQIASDVFSVSVDRLTANTSPDDIESWDSVRHIILIMAVEQQFALRLTPEDIDEATSLGRIGALVERRLEQDDSAPRTHADGD